MALGNRPDIIVTFDYISANNVARAILFKGSLKVWMTYIHLTINHGDRDILTLRCSHPA